MAAQAQLLRVIQEKVLVRVGGNKPIPVDVRIIAATNANLIDRIRLGQFRKTISSIKCTKFTNSPLRSRKEDIPYLINHFIKKHMGNENIEIPSIFMKKLQNYQWYGNIRELQNFVEKFIILSRDTKDYFKLLEELYFDLISSDTKLNDFQEDKISVTIGTLKEMELEIIEKLSREYYSDKTALAKNWYKQDKHGLN